MAGRNAADILFVVDTSESMQPCIDALRSTLVRFLDSFRNTANERWDVRVDFVAHRAKGAVSHESVFERDLHEALYQRPQCRFFTEDLDAVAQRLGELTTAGDERPLIALDFALDAPWRPTSSARRIVIFFTDEPHETSEAPRQDAAKLPQLIDKIHALKVMLFLVTPDSETYDTLSSVNGADWQKVPVGRGMAGVDVSRVLLQIGKSIAASQTPLGAPVSVTRGLFDQSRWGQGTFGTGGDSA